jgi:hypothetical protein
MAGFMSWNVYVPMATALRLIGVQRIQIPRLDPIAAHT